LATPAFLLMISNAVLASKVTRRAVNVSSKSVKFFTREALSSLCNEEMILINELMEVELLTVLAEQLSEKEAIMKVFFKIADSFLQLNLVVEPVQQ
jgi:hypothetical protein